MRIVKLSKDLFGFDTNGACKAYLKDVLPWTGGNFHFAGNGNKIALDKFSEGENILFSHDGSIVAIVKSAMRIEQPSLLVLSSKGRSSRTLSGRPKTSESSP